MLCMRSVLWGLYLSLGLHLCRAAVLDLSSVVSSLVGSQADELDVQVNDLPPLSIYVMGTLFGGFLHIGKWDHD